MKIQKRIQFWIQNYSELVKSMKPLDRDDFRLFSPLGPIPQKIQISVLNKNIPLSIEKEI